jgi:hypothetical protein
VSRLLDDKKRNDVCHAAHVCVSDSLVLICTKVKF